LPDRASTPEELLHRSIINEIVRLADGIDVHIVADR
jgi:hypothetical protein